MDVSVAGLKNLIFKLHRFVNGSADEKVQLEDGREIKTMAGIEKVGAERSLVQQVRDYDNYQLASVDALGGVILQQGYIVRIHNDPDKRLRGLFEVTPVKNLRRVDGYELFSFFPVEGTINRTSTDERHVAFEVNIDKPLLGQSTHGAFTYAAFLRTNTNVKTLLNGTVVYGIMEDGVPYVEIDKLRPNVSLDFIHQVEDMGDYFSYQFIATPLVAVSNWTISTKVDGIYQPEKY
ncbi:hypothetical protein nACB2_058 [Acinetobacter phage nACB2]|nr:hypothetical protein nACB2_058 [Acinetobacter phage nACB2]